MTTTTCEFFALHALQFLYISSEIPLDKTVNNDPVRNGSPALAVADLGFLGGDI